MNNSTKDYLVLYMTSECHLCEQAQAVAVAALGYGVAEIDIIDDAALYEHYGMVIPVLKNNHTGRELNWPFASQDVRQFIATSSSKQQ